MKAIERRCKIELLIKEKKELEISQLIKMFDVSSVTIRSDLIYLEQKGVVKRLFGKIILKNDVENILNVENLYEKRKIGKYAASLIEPGESIMFYVGTTSQLIIQYIDASINIIAVTNSISIAQELRSFPKIKTVLIGGNLSHDIGASYGPQAIKQIMEYNFDKVFLSVDGIDSEYGITNSKPFECDVNRSIIERSNTVIVVADYSKIGNVTFIQMGDISEVDVLITDKRASSDALEKITSKGVKVVTV